MCSRSLKPLVDKCSVRAAPPPHGMTTMLSQTPAGTTLEKHLHLFTFMILLSYHQLLQSSIVQRVDKRKNILAVIIRKLIRKDPQSLTVKNHAKQLVSAALCSSSREPASVGSLMGSCSVKDRQLFDQHSHIDNGYQIPPSRRTSV